MNSKQDLPIIAFASPAAWEAWLAEQHATSGGLWLKIAKKDSGVETVSYAEALEVALCYGWIDGQKAAFDERYWLQRFTPRKPGSKWSKINRDKAEELMKTDETTSQKKESKMDVVATLIADIEPAEVGEPRERPFRHPAMPAQRLAALDALAGDTDLDMAAVQCGTAGALIVRLVGMEFGGPLAGSPSWPLDRRTVVEQALQERGVGAMGATQTQRERTACALDHKRVRRARCAAIRRMRPGRCAPFVARTLRLSRLARLQSIWSASPKRLSRVWCRRPQTPAACQSRRRRQQVAPLPQPLSWGSISQGMPLLSTTMIPLSTARSGMRGRPPLGLGGSGGSNGAMASHSVSLTNGFLMPIAGADGVPGFCKAV